MRRLFVCLFVVSAVLLAPASVSAKADPKPSAAIDCAVRVMSLSRDGKSASMGSGSILRSGNLLTAWHVVSKAGKVWAKDRHGAVIDAKGWVRVGKQDVAIVFLKTKFPVVGLLLADGLTTGTSVAKVWAYWGIGHTDGNAVMLMGTVYPKAKAPKGLPKSLSGSFYGTGIPVSPGMSGAPLIVKDRVIAVCSFGPLGGSGLGYSYWAKIDLSILHSK